MMPTENPNIMCDPYQIVVIGGSLGGAQAVQTLLRDLPDEFPLPMVIVLHRSKTSDEMLISILQKATSLPVIEAEEKEVIVPGRVYLAPADYHLLVEQNNPAEHGSLALSTEAPVLLARPSIDVLFQSAAETYARRVIGVILTGASQDGAEGLAAITAHGGMTVVQDPSTAESAIMPAAAIAAGAVKHIVPLSEISSLVTRAVR